MLWHDQVTFFVYVGRFLDRLCLCVGVNCGAEYYILCVLV